MRYGLHALLQCGAGIALVLGARGLSGMLHRVRYGDSSAPIARDAGESDE